jgi:hypothetical protein
MSLNDLKGGNVWEAIRLLITRVDKIANSSKDTITVDQVVIPASQNPIAGGAVYSSLGNKQDKLVSGSSIKTINGDSILGSGDLVVEVTQSVIKNNLGVATDYTDGYLSSTDHAIFNGKQSHLGYVPENITNKDTYGGYAGLTLLKINFKNALNTFTSFFTNSNTEVRTYTFPDKDGTVAMVGDIPDISNKVDKVTGKGLSENDLTDTLKSNYDSAYSFSQDNSHINTDLFSNGRVSGGIISVNTDTTKFDITAGVGYITIGGVYTRITWNSFAAIATLGYGYTYIAVNQYGILNLSGTIESRSSYINLGHIYHNPGLNRITVVWNTPDIIGNYVEVNSEFINNVFGTIVANGFNVSESTALHLNVSSGELWSKLSKFNFNGNTTFTKILKASNIGIFSNSENPNIVDVTRWNNTLNNNTTALVTMTDTYWKKDLIVINPNGGIYYVYGTAEYATEDAAVAGGVPNYSDQLLSDGNAFLFTIVLQKGDTSIANRLYDVRPLMSRIFGSAVSSSGGTVVSYNDLLNKPFIPTAHNQLTDRDVAGNHQRLVPITDSTTSIQIMMADGLVPVFNFDTLNKTLWLAGTGVPTTGVGQKYVIWDTVNAYLQTLIQNLSGGGDASSDMVATRDDGDDTHGFVDLGINSSGYNNTDYSAMPAKAGYCYTSDGKMIIGSDSDSVRIIAGGTTTEDIVMELTPTSIVANKDLTAPNLYNKAQTLSYIIAYG